MVFWLVLKLEISYRVWNLILVNLITMKLEGFWFLLEHFFGRLYIDLEIDCSFLCLKSSAPSSKP
jgi:hypothetical protein